MITSSTVQARDIRDHYDISTVLYRLLWGPHIHHGLWLADESPRAAVAGGERVVDVGCGMGGSSVVLARSGCHVLGVTISPLQRWWAATSAHWHRVAQRTEFRCQDAEAVELTPGTIDVVWSIECTEHFFDKPRFFRRAANWLAPNGRLAICAWLAGPQLHDAHHDCHRVQLVRDVCEGFYCPSLGTMDDYCRWMADAGLEVEHCADLTRQVTRTWEICQRRVRRTGVRWFGPWLDRRAEMFLNRFSTILEAYRCGAMEYGCFVARKTE
jgi:tocopherol O-methyltransferase